MADRTKIKTMVLLPLYKYKTTGIKAKNGKIAVRHKEKLERAGKGCRFVYETPQTATEEMIEATRMIFVLRL